MQEPRWGLNSFSFKAGHWVAGLATAALSVRGPAMALVVLRGALIRTGIGPLIVGAGELVYQFSHLVTRVGCVGEAFRLLGDLAPGVWLDISLSLDAAFANMAAGCEGLKAAGLSALDSTIAGVGGFDDRTATIFQGAWDDAVAIWGQSARCYWRFRLPGCERADQRRRGDAERRRHPSGQLPKHSCGNPGEVEAVDQTLLNFRSRKKGRPPPSLLTHQASPLYHPAHP